MNITEFFILWIISIVIYFFTFPISLTLTIILCVILIIGYVYYKKNYINSINQKIKRGELKYLEFKNKKSILELFAMPIIYLLFNILSISKIIDFGENLILLNLLLLFVPSISIFIIDLRNPSLNNGLIISEEYCQEGLTGSKMKKKELNINRGKKEYELIIENLKNGKKHMYEFENPDLILTELKNIT